MLANEKKIILLRPINSMTFINGQRKDGKETFSISTIDFEIFVRFISTRALRFVIIVLL